MNYFPDQVFIGLQETPSEISLVIPLAGCSHHCVGCHSPHLQDKNGGEVLTEERYLKYLQQYKDKASCICFFGGESHGVTLAVWAGIAHGYGFKTALYSGFDFEEIQEGLFDGLLKGLADCFDYVKCGSYVEELGGLDMIETNQVMWKKVEDYWVNITSEFQRYNYV